MTALSLHLEDANGSAYVATLWGSYCLACETASEHSQRCDLCGSEKTVGLWTQEHKGTATPRSTPLDTRLAPAAPAVEAVVRVFRQVGSASGRRRLARLREDWSELAKALDVLGDVHRTYAGGES